MTLKSILAVAGIRERNILALLAPGLKGLNLTSTLEKYLVIIVNGGVEGVLLMDVGFVKKRKKTKKKKNEKFKATWSRTTSKYGNVYIRLFTRCLPFWKPMMLTHLLTSQYLISIVSSS